MLKPGDLVDMDGRWLVRQVLKRARVVRLLGIGPDGVLPSDLEIPADSDDTGKCQVVANVIDSWPMIAAPTRRSAGPFRILHRPLGMTRQTPLLVLVDWVPADPLREGGPLFFNPSLKLRPGEVLAATHKNGAVSRINVPLSFGTIEKRVAVADAKRAPAVPTDVYDTLGNDEFDV